MASKALLQALFQALLPPEADMAASQALFQAFLPAKVIMAVFAFF